MSFLRKIVPFAATLALCLVSTPAAAGPASDSDTRTSDAYGVHVAATPGRLEGMPVWEFALAFHSSGPALREDLVRSAVLVAGGVARRPIAWDGMGPTAGHHRVGVLKFVAVTPLPEAIELRLQRPAEPKPRVFRWESGGWFALDSGAR